MKYQIMIGMLFTLLARRKVSAGELAAKFDVSVRTVYRYVEEMIVSNIPIDVARGAQGGIYISDAYKLPRGFLTREEYRKTLDAMLAMWGQTHDAALGSAVDKLRAELKAERTDTALSGNILVDSGTWGDERTFSNKLALAERAVGEREALLIDYVDRGGVKSRRTVLPHLLVYKQNVWYLFAWCTSRNAFRLFKIGRIRSAVALGEHFERKPFTRDDVPLSFWREERTVDARFEISPETVPFAEEWLGVENVREENGVCYADVTLPDDGSLVGKILSAGAGLRVLSPAPLRERVLAEAEKLAAAYRAD